VFLALVNFRLLYLSIFCFRSNYSGIYWTFIFTFKFSACLLSPIGLSLFSDSEFSVIDLVCDDEPNATAEKCPTCEDHVSFSLEGTYCFSFILVRLPFHI